MRHFKLVNSAGEVLDITTKEILFYGMSGLGFEEENDFRQIGEFWWLNHTNYNQATISGNMLFNEASEADPRDPYIKYREFVSFAIKAPLTLLYNPLGPIEIRPDNGKWDAYYRTVRVSKLEKTEKNEYGVIDSPIEFICYTPWYQMETREINYSSSSQLTGWIWQGTRTTTDPDTGTDTVTWYPPLVFEPEGVSVDGTVVIPPFVGDNNRAQFGDEPQSYAKFELDSSVLSPTKLVIYGPITNPTWTHSVKIGDRYEAVSLGGFAENENVTLNNGERLEIDCTSGSYSIKKYNANGSIDDIYGKRDFNQDCFIHLRQGENHISVSSATGDLPSRLVVEGQIYYATV